MDVHHWSIQQGSLAMTMAVTLRSNRSMFWGTGHTGAANWCPTAASRMHAGQIHQPQHYTGNVAPNTLAHMQTVTCKGEYELWMSSENKTTENPTKNVQCTFEEICLVLNACPLKQCLQFIR